MSEPSPFPRLSAPMSAYELLTRVVPIVLRADTGMIRMGTVLRNDVWQSIHDHLHGLALDHVGGGRVGPSDHLVSRHHEAQKPRCGWVGDVASWVLALTGIEPKAERLSRQVAALFDLTPADVYDLCYNLPLCKDREQGTSEHAQRTIAHVMEFAAQHRAHLQARTIVPA